MGIKEELEKFVAEMEEMGLQMDHASMPAGVFFESEKSAQVFADKFDKDLIQIDGGWVARNQHSSN